MVRTATVQYPLYAMLAWDVVELYVLESLVSVLGSISKLALFFCVLFVADSTAPAGTTSFADTEFSSLLSSTTGVVVASATVSVITLCLIASLPTVYRKG